MSLKNKNVLLLILGHFASAPRPQKEANALVKRGANVFIRGMWWDEELSKEDQQLAREIGVDYAPLVDYRKTDWSSFSIRLRAKIARKLYLVTGLVTPRCLGVAAPEMLKASRKINPDLVILHCEPALWVGKKLQLKGYKIGVDFEDWFSQDLSEQARRERPVAELQNLERYHLHNAAFCFATTNAMANALATDAGSARIPTVVPNCFPRSCVKTKNGIVGDNRGDEISLYWYSQTIGSGRGLEILGQALTMLSGNWKLRLRGNLRGKNDDWFCTSFPAEIRHRIEILPVVSNKYLSSHNSSHDVGLALETPYCKSRDLTATNKIFDYLRAGLAIVATDTLGQKEVANNSCSDAIKLIPADNAAALTDTLQSLIENPALLKSMKASAKKAAASQWSWEIYEPLLLDACENAFEKSP
ncbi:MAG: hypothetical protein V3U75_09740 [Methylococcaceae bacterium]